MAARRFQELDIDFESFNADLAKLAPPNLGLSDVLSRLPERMLEQQARGVRVG